MLVWSRYNHLFEKDSEFFIYNSLSNSFALVPKGIYSYLIKCKVGKTVDGLPKETIDDLKRMKALVISDETERLRIKHETQRHRFSNSQLILTVCPTLSCNFRCGYCFEQNHPDINMDDDTENRLIDFIKSRTLITGIGMTWFGGEPLLQFRRIESLTEKIFAIGKNYSAGIITNGFLLNEKIAEKLSYLKINRIQITLDGLETTHDKRRVLKNGGPTFHRIIENIAVTTETSPQTHISIRVNIDKDNTEDYLRIFEYIQSQHWKNVSIHPAFVEKITKNHCGYTLSPEVRMKLIHHYADKTNTPSNGFYPDGIRDECAIRNINSYVIGPKGEIYKCWNDVGDPDRVVGNINGKITNEALLLDYLTGADPLEDPKCMECILLPICGGGCPYERLKKSPDHDICPLLKNNLNDFLWKKYLKQKSYMGNM